MHNISPTGRAAMMDCFLPESQGHLRPAGRAHYLALMSDEIDMDSMNLGTEITGFMRPRIVWSTAITNEIGDTEIHNLNEIRVYIATGVAVRSVAMVISYIVGDGAKPYAFSLPNSFTQSTLPYIFTIPVGGLRAMFNVPVSTGTSSGYLVREKLLDWIFGDGEKPAATLYAALCEIGNAGLDRDITECDYEGYERIALNLVRWEMFEATGLRFTNSPTWNKGATSEFPSAIGAVAICNGSVKGVQDAFWYHNINDFNPTVCNHFVIHPDDAWMTFWDELFIGDGQDTTPEWQAWRGFETTETFTINNYGVAFSRPLCSQVNTGDHSAGHHAELIHMASFDMTLLQEYNFNVWMYHSLTAPSMNDLLSIRVSVDGWVNDEFFNDETSMINPIGGFTEIGRYDGSEGWKKHTWSLNAYGTETALWIEFYTSGKGGEDIFIDNWSLGR